MFFTKINFFFISANVDIFISDLVDQICRKKTVTVISISKNKMSSNQVQFSKSKKENILDLLKNQETSPCAK